MDNLTGMDLAGLIRRLKGDRSYAELADASGGALSRQRWQQLGAAKTSAGMPDPTTLQVVARTLGVSDRVVVLAAARTAGLDVGDTEGSFSLLLPPSVDRLSDGQVSAVLAVIRELLELSHGTAIDPDQARARGAIAAHRDAETQGGNEPESVRNGTQNRHM